LKVELSTYVFKDEKSILSDVTLHINSYFWYIVCSISNPNMFYGSHIQWRNWHTYSSHENL